MKARAWIAAGVLLAVLSLALVGPALAGHDPAGLPYAPPGGGAPLGTDKLGNSVLDRILAGGRTIVTVSAAVLLLAYALGAAAGMLAALRPGWPQTLVMRAVDVLMGLPAFITLSVVVVATGRGITGVAVAAVVILVPDIVRVVRNATTQAMAHDYVEAAFARGETGRSVLAREVLPNLAPVLAADAGVRFVGAVYAVATASFLGYGVQPPAADWGLMILDNRDGLLLQPLAVAAPAAALLVLLLSANVLLDALTHPAVRVPRRRPAVATLPDGPQRGTAVARAHGMRVVTAHTGQPIVDGADLVIAAGEIVALVGGSGSGKTTLAQALLGHYRPGLAYAGGRVELAGTVLTGLSHRALRRLRSETVGYTAQDPRTALSPVRRIGAQIGEALRARGVPRAERPTRIAAALRAMGLPDDPAFARRYPHQLSGGQRQRVAIAIALAHQPRLLVLDEPTSALDTVITATLLRDLAALRDSTGLSILLITHDLPAVATIADRVAVMTTGRIRETGPTAEILGSMALTATAVPEPSGAAVTGHPALTVRGLRAAHRGAPILHGIGLDVVEGGCLSIVGTSGAGKTTLLRCVAGLHPPAGGTVTLDGAPLPATVGQRDRGQLRRMQLVPQNPYDSLNPRHTIAQIVGRPLALYRITTPAEIPAEVARLLDQVGLPAEYAHRRPAQLSGGQRQRVALARALAARPDVLLCDEITSALDTTVAAAILDLLHQLRTTLGLTLLLVTHDLFVARRLGDHLLVLDRGEVAEHGPIETVLGAPTSPITQALLNARREWTDERGPVRPIR